MKGFSPDEAARKEILNICEKAASPHGVIAASIHDSHTYGRSGKKVDIDVLLIVGSPKLTLRFRRKALKALKGATASLLAVDQKTFQKDVEGDWLGGLLVESMLIPYEPLVNEAFLWEQEVKAKKRIIIDILGNLVLEYPEMSQELLIKPEYFMFEAMAKKASLYPPIAYRFLKILRDDFGEGNQELMMRGFKAALEAAAEEELVNFSDGYVKISSEFIETIQRKRLRMLNLLKTVRNSILRHSFEVFPKMMRTFITDYWIYTKHLMETGNFTGILLPGIEDPKKYVFVPTPLGLVSFSDKVTIEDFVKRTVPNGHSLKVETERLGGVLNAVYTLRVNRDKEEQRVIVKVFKDWYGWKWFPLALWALGTRGFAVLGKPRLEREYTINRFLSSQGINVPRIIYVSPRERLIFQEYVEGDSLTTLIRQICSPKKESAESRRVIGKVGRELAKVHGLGVALGDCKPENIIITQNGRIFFVDLEQAQKGGDQAWDIAELLYYSGHYGSLRSIEGAQKIAREFIEGYLEAGGKTENIRKARSPRYVKVFSFFTPPHVLYAISSTCEEKLKAKKGK